MRPNTLTYTAYLKKIFASLCVKKERNTQKKNLSVYICLVKLRKYIAYSLLLSFFVLLTPRQWWHDCDHVSHSHQSTSDDPHQAVHLEKKDCFACDFDLGIIGEPEMVVRFFSRKTYINHVNDHVKSIEVEKIKDHSHRGPPCI